MSDSFYVIPFELDKDQLRKCLSRIIEEVDILKGTRGSKVLVNLSQTLISKSSNAEVVPSVSYVQSEIEALNANITSLETKLNSILTLLSDSNVMVSE